MRTARPEGPHQRHQLERAPAMPPSRPRSASRLPGIGASVTATVASGQCQVAIGVGNACGKSYSNVVSFAVP
jgi:hypothetical protein